MKATSRGGDFADCRVRLHCKSNFFVLRQSYKSRAFRGIGNVRKNTVKARTVRLSSENKTSGLSPV